MHRVRDAGLAALERRARPWTIEPPDWFADVDRLRGLFGGLFGADAEGVAIVPATSYGFAVAARNLRVGPGDRVLVLAEEYPSGIYTWRATGAELVTVSREPGRTWTDAVLAALDETRCYAAVRGDALRIAPHLHVTDRDVDTIVAVVADALSASA